MRQILRAALIVAALATPGAAQTTITGRVVADDTGNPIANARVTLASTALGTPVVLTDADGRFAFPAPPTRSNVVANKTGYGRGEATPADGTRPIELRLKKPRRLRTIAANSARRASARKRSSSRWSLPGKNRSDFRMATW